MEQKKQYDYSNGLLLFLVFVLILLFIYGLWERAPDLDDAWIGEHAYWLAKDGYVHSELMRGVNMQETLFVVHHKLLNLQGAIFIELFGFSVYSLKSVSLVYFLVFLIVFSFYTTRWKVLFRRKDLLLALIIIFSFPWLYKYAFVYRPEVMMMTIGFLGYLILEKFFDKGIYIYSFIAGLLFGLNLVIHLNGIILIVSAFILLLLNRQFKGGFIFGIGAILSSIIYFYDYSGQGYFALWWHQFFDSPSLDSLADAPLLLKPLYNMLNEYLRYFYKLNIATFSVLVILTYIIGFSFFLKKHTNLFRFSLIIAFSTGFIAMHKSQQYLLLNFPYVVILIVLMFRAINENKIDFLFYSWQNHKTKLRGGLVAIFAVFMIVSMYHNTKLANDKFDPDENRLISGKYASEKTADLNIVAPMTFIFNEIEYYNRIQGDLCYIELQKLNASIYGTGFFKKAKSFNIDLMLISKKFEETLGLENLRPGDSTVGYYFESKNDQLLVFKRLHK